MEILFLKPYKPLQSLKYLKNVAIIGLGLPFLSISMKVSLLLCHILLNFLSHCDLDNNVSYNNVGFCTEEFHILLQRSCFNNSARAVRAQS